MDSYTQHMPVLQRTTFWSNYMSGLKGSLAARDKVTETVLASPFSQYRAVDVTMYDLIYGEISSVSSSHLSPLTVSAGSHSDPRPDLSGYENYRPLHTSIYGRGRTAHHSQY